MQNCRFKLFLLRRSERPDKSPVGKAFPCAKRERESCSPKGLTDEVFTPKDGPAGPVTVSRKAD